MTKISKSETAFRDTFVGPKLTGTQKAKILRDAYQRCFCGPVEPKGRRRKEADRKAFYANFVGPRIPISAKAYQKVHSAKHYRAHKASRLALKKERKAAQAQRLPAWFGDF